MKALKQFYFVVSGTIDAAMMMGTFTSLRTLGAKRYTSKRLNNASSIVRNSVDVSDSVREESTFKKRQ